MRAERERVPAGVGRVPAEVGGLTRRELGARAGGAAGALLAGGILAGGLLADAPAVLADTADPAGLLDPAQVQTLSALLETIAPAASAAASIGSGIARFGAIYGSSGESVRSALAARLALLEAGAPGGSFAALPLSARRTFVDRTLYAGARSVSFPAGAPFAGYVQAEAAALRTLALDSAPTTVSLEPPAWEPLAGPPPAPAPLSAEQALAVAVASMVRFGLMAFVSGASA
jgi:hypothetical protein